MATGRVGKWDDSESLWTQDLPSEKEEEVTVTPTLFEQKPVTQLPRPVRRGGRGLLRLPRVTRPVNSHVTVVEEEKIPAFAGGEPGLYVLERCGGGSGPEVPPQFSSWRALNTRTYPFDKAGGVLRLGAFDPHTGQQKAWTHFAIQGTRETLVEVQWTLGQVANTPTAGRIPAHALIFFEGAKVPQMYQVLSGFSLLHSHLKQGDIEQALADLRERDGINQPEQPHLLGAPGSDRVISQDFEEVVLGSSVEEE